MARRIQQKNERQEEQARALLQLRMQKFEGAGAGALPSSMSISPTRSARKQPNGEGGGEAGRGWPIEASMSAVGFYLKPLAERMSFSFKQLGLSVQIAGKKVKILEGVSGSIEHSTLVAVMGPSGAGKTTFMNVLCGRAFYGTVSGSSSAS